MNLKPHELSVVNILCSNVLSKRQIESLRSEVRKVEFEPTGVGYHLVVRNKELPLENTVCNTPFVSGSFGKIIVGYIVFLGDGLLHIDCHQMCEQDIPNNFRELDVQINT